MLGTEIYGNLRDFLMKFARSPIISCWKSSVENHLGTAFSRFLVLGMHIGRTHVQSGQPFHMHPETDWLHWLSATLQLAINSNQVAVGYSTEHIGYGQWPYAVAVCHVCGLTCWEWRQMKRDVIVTSSMTCTDDASDECDSEREQ